MIEKVNELGIHITKLYRSNKQPLFASILKILAIVRQDFAIFDFFLDFRGK